MIEGHYGGVDAGSGNFMKSRIPFHTHAFTLSTIRSALESHPKPRPSMCMCYDGAMFNTWFKRLCTPRDCTSFVSILKKVDHHQTGGESKE